MGARPLIGVTTSEVRRKKDAKPLPQGDLQQPELALGVVYARAVEQAGGLPVVLAPVEDEAVTPLVEHLAGVCVSGGPDMDPAAYGAEPHPRLGPVEPELDAFELAVVRRADARGIPVLGDLPRLPGAQRGAGRHPAPARAGRRGRLGRPPPDGVGPGDDARREDRGRLAPGGDRRPVSDLDVNAFHHQAVDRLGRGLRAVAWADDGIVEAVEGDGEALYLGVQWHVETLVHLPRHARVFEALVDAAAGERARRAA